jgi:hypothetical protein
MDLHKSDYQKKLLNKKIFYMIQSHGMNFIIKIGVVAIDWTFKVSPHCI